MHSVFVSFRLLSSAPVPTHTHTILSTYVAMSQVKPVSLKFAASARKAAMDRVFRAPVSQEKLLPASRYRLSLQAKQAAGAESEAKATKEDEEEKKKAKSLLKLSRKVDVSDLFSSSRRLQSQQVAKKLAKTEGQAFAYAMGQKKKQQQPDHYAFLDATGEGHGGQGGQGAAGLGSDYDLLGRVQTLKAEPLAPDPLLDMEFGFRLPGGAGLLDEMNAHHPDTAYFGGEEEGKEGRTRVEGLVLEIEDDSIGSLGSFGQESVEAAHGANARDSPMGAGASAGNWTPVGGDEAGKQEREQSHTHAQQQQQQQSALPGSFHEYYGGGVGSDHLVHDRDPQQPNSRILTPISVPAKESLYRMVIERCAKAYNNPKLAKTDRVGLLTDKEYDGLTLFDVMQDKKKKQEKEREKEEKRLIRMSLRQG